MMELIKWTAVCVVISLFPPLGLLLCWLFDDVK